jgi:plasmid stability protein
MKVTIAFRDDALYRSVKVRAAASGRQIRDVVEEALEEWLERREDAEDVAVSRKAIAAYERGERDEWVDAEELFQRMVAEGRIDYQTDPER